MRSVECWALPLRAERGDWDDARRGTIVALPAAAARLPGAVLVPLGKGFGRGSKRDVVGPLALVPLTEQVTGLKTKSFGLLRGDFEHRAPHGRLPGSFAETIRAVSTRGRIAYVEAQFWAGEGVQASIVWDGGEIVFGPIIEEDGAPPQPLREAAINRALRALGVRRAPCAVDEFSTVGLDRHRYTSNWVSAGAHPAPNRSYD